MISPVVMKMLTDAHMAEINRQIGQERLGDWRDRRTFKLSMPLALGTLLLAALLGSGLIH